MIDDPGRPQQARVVDGVRILTIPWTRLGAFVEMDAAGRPLNEWMDGDRLRMELTLFRAGRRYPGGTNEDGTRRPSADERKDCCQILVRDRMQRITDVRHVDWEGFKPLWGCNGKRLDPQGRAIFCRRFITEPPRYVEGEQVWIARSSADRRRIEAAHMPGCPCAILAPQ